MKYGLNIMVLEDLNMKYGLIGFKLSNGQHTVGDYVCLFKPIYIILM